MMKPSMHYFCPQITQMDADYLALKSVIICVICGQKNTLPNLRNLRNLRTIFNQEVQT